MLQHTLYQDKHSHNCTHEGVLLRDNFLSEFSSDVQKELARANLGIQDYTSEIEQIDARLTEINESIKNNTFIADSVEWENVKNKPAGIQDLLDNRLALLALLDNNDEPETPQISTTTWSQLVYSNTDNTTIQDYVARQIGNAHANIQALIEQNANDIIDLQNLIDNIQPEGINYWGTLVKSEDDNTTIAEAIKAVDDKFDVLTINNISGLNTKLTTIESDIADVKTLTADYDTVKSNAAKANTNSTTLAQLRAEFDAYVTSNPVDVDSFGSKVTALETLTATHTLQITALQNATPQSNIKSWSDLDSLTGSVTDNTDITEYVAGEIAKIVIPTATTWDDIKLQALQDADLKTLITQIVADYCATHCGSTSTTPISPIITLNTFDDSVTISGGNDCDIYYSLGDSNVSTASTKYTAPFKLSSNTTVYAIAVSKTDNSLVSDASSKSVTLSTIPLPTLSQSGNKVTASVSGGYTIQYSTNGTTYVNYSNPITLQENVPTTVYVKATNGNRYSTVKSQEFTYTVSEGEVAIPSITIIDNVITINTSGNKVYYTIDGTDPKTTNGIEYTNPITLTEDVTLRAVATDGKIYSDELTQTCSYLNPTPDEPTDSNAIYYGYLPLSAGLKLADVQALTETKCEELVTQGYLTKTTSSVSNLNTGDFAEKGFYVIYGENITPTLTNTMGMIMDYRVTPDTNEGKPIYALTIVANNTEYLILNITKN